MHLALQDVLVCPSCHARLTWQLDRAERDEVIEATAVCTACRREYAVGDGVGVFLTDVSDDTWRDATARLDAALDGEPALRARLLDAPLADLNGADLVFRGMVLEARDQQDGAAQAFNAADPLLYGSELRACRDRLLDAAVEQCVPAAWATDVVDIASGRGALVERAARADLRVVATDLSPVAMLRLRRRLVHLGLGDRVDCLACDAAALPFADGAVPALSTFVGLQNIPRPDNTLRELRRVSAGPMRIVGSGYPTDDAANREALAALGYGAVADSAALTVALAEAGWATMAVDRCVAPADPTPRGEVIAGGVVDGLPVASTTFEWYLLEALPGS